ncbi:MAG: DUF4105 domain-containing protein [Myxococcota bacterium]|nr:DUF4105 domain-containing protein [Myxococcota bacterium]
MKVAIAICLAISLLLPASAQAEPSETPQNLAVHVLTIGPGHDLFSRFGHIGLVVEDLEAQTMIVYNFGTFDFLDPDLRLRYTLGELRYWLSTEPLTPILRYYKAEDRDLMLRTLNLGPEKTAWLVQQLARLALPENREYLYRHYIDNCCTRIRDLLDEASSGALAKAYKGKASPRTFRDWTRRALGSQLVSGTAIDFALGPAIDEPIDRWHEEFLPEVLSEDLDSVKLPGGEALVASRRVLFKREGINPFALGESFDAPVVACLVGLLLFGIAVPIGFGKARPQQSARAAGLGLLTWGLLGGLGGLILLLFWTITTHYDTHYNENLLTFPPTHLWLFVPGLKLLRHGVLSEKLERRLRRYLLASLMLVVVALLLKLRLHPQDNAGFLAFAAALDVLVLAALFRSKVFARLRW